MVWSPLWFLDTVDLEVPTDPWWWDLMECIWISLCICSLVLPDWPSRQDSPLWLWVLDEGWLCWLKSLPCVSRSVLVLQWGAKALQYLTSDQGMKCPAINHGNLPLLWWEQIKYKPLAITLSPVSCDFTYILQRYIHFKTSIPLQQFCTFCFPGYISTWYSLPLPW